MTDHTTTENIPAPPGMSRRQFLALGGGLAALAACGTNDGAASSSPGAGASTTTGATPAGDSASSAGPLTIWASTALAGDASSSLATAAADYGDAEVIVEGFPANDLVDKTLTAISGGGGPDAIIVDATAVPQLGAAELIADVTDPIAGIADQFFTGNVQAGTFMGRNYGVPFDTGNVGLFWNRSMFDQAGIDGPPQTWEDLAAAAEELTNGSQFGYMLGALGYGSFLFWPWLWQNGGRILTEDNTAAAFNDEAGQEAFAFYSGLHFDRGVVPPTFTAVNQSWDQYIQPFLTETVGMMAIGDWGISPLEEGNPDLDYEVAPLPRGNDDATILGGNSVVMSDRAADPDAAWRFIEYLTAAEQRWVVEDYGRIPARRDVVGSEFAQETQARQTFVDQAEFAVARPAIPNWGDIEWGAMANMWDRVIQGQEEPLAGLATAEQEVNEILAG